MWHERKSRSRWAATWPPPYTQTILPCSEGACTQEEKRKQPVALKQRDVAEDEKATIDFFFSPRLFFPRHFWCEIFFFTSSLALLFGRGVCLNCNSGTIYDISAGARNKTHNYMCVVSGGGGSRSTAPRQRHSSSTDGLFFSRRGDGAVNFNET